MKTHTTNYFDTFIEIADDTKAQCGTQPPSREQKTIAELQYEMIRQNPYKYSSDDVLFGIFAQKNDLTESDLEAARTQYFSKGQACMRTSPLARTYGFGIHFNHEGKVAIYGMETEEYRRFTADVSIKKTKAMRSTKK